MKVLHINCNYIGTTLHQIMVETLDEMGVENEIFVPTYDKNLAVIEPNNNVCVSECFRKVDRVIFDYKQEKIMAAIEKRYDISSFDLIHAYTLFTDGNVARKLSEKYNIPFVVAIRNTDVNDFFKKMLHLRKRGVKTMQEARAIFFLSKPYYNQVFTKYIPEEKKELLQAKSFVIPNGIDKFWFENKPNAKPKLDERLIKLVYAGRIDKNKNVPTTQQAMEILKKEGYNVSLTVVGKVQDKKEFRIINENQNTICLPQKGKNELIHIYRSSDIFVMPSFTESFGLVYAEAMSQGIPVIYTKNQGFDGNFLDGEVGYSVNSKDPVSVAEGIKKVINNYCKIAGNCVAKSKKFDWHEICNCYVSIYNKVISKENNKCGA